MMRIQIRPLPSVVRRVLGAALIALPIVVFLTSMVINRGWAYVVTMLGIAVLSVGCIVVGNHLLAPRKKSR
jgi:hypothetical protein